jgi:uncharacterized protein (DUF2461 family)
VSRGSPADHPAAAYLKRKQFLMGREFPAALATSPRFYATLVRLFEQMAPVITFLNEPLGTAVIDPLGPMSGSRPAPRQG